MQAARIQVRGTRRIVRRPCLIKQLARRVDAGITSVQEWLEGDDKAARAAGYGILALIFAYFIGQIVRWLLG